MTEPPALLSRLPRALRAAAGAPVGWRDALLGAAGAPFLLLPLPLTIAAPDVYAGFSVHLRAAALLALVGAVAGLVVAAARQLGIAAGSQEDREGTRLVARLLLALLAARALIPLTGVGVGAVSLLRLTLGTGTLSAPPPLGGAASTLAGAALLLAAGRRSRERGGPRLLAAAAWIFLGPPVVAVSTRALDVGAVAGLLPLWLVAGIPLVARPRPHTQRALAALGGMVGVGGAAFVARVGPRTAIALVSIELTGADLAWGPGLGLGVGIALGLLAPLLSRPLGALAAAPMPPLSRLLPLLPIPGIAIVSALFARLVGGGLAELLGLAHEGTGPPLPLPHPAATAAWAALALRAFSAAGLDPRLRGEARARLAGGWSLLVLGALLVAATGSDRWPWFVVAIVLAAATVAWARLPARLDRWLAVSGCLLMGPVLWAYVDANLIPAALPRGMAWLGLGFGALGPLLGRAGNPHGPVGLAVERGLLILAGILPLFLGIAWAMWPPWVLGGLVAGAVFVGLGRLRWWPRLLPPPTLAAGLWVAFYVAFFQVIAFKTGPSAARCAAVAEDGSAIAIVERQTLGSEYRGAFPYDVIPVLEAGSLVMSWKRIDRTGGYLEFRPLDNPALRSQIETVRGGGAFWPERFARVPRNEGLLVQVIGAGAHALWRFHVDPDPGNQVGRMVFDSELPLTWEPANPAIDPIRNRLVMSYVPNWQSTNPLIEVFDLDGMASAGAPANTTQRVQIADFLAVDHGGGGYYVPAFLDLIRFALVEFDPDTLATTRTAETFHPTVGIAVDSRRDRVWMTNPMAGTVEVWQLSTLRPLSAVPAGRFPRDLEYDPIRGRLHVAGYSNGQITTWSTTGPSGELVELGRAFVGGLARGIGHDPGTGRLFAASGCGVYEIVQNP